MDNKKILIVALVFAAASFMTNTFAASAIRVISDRTPSHLEALFGYYERTTGVKIEAVFIKKGLIARLKSRPTEADLVITNAADLLEAAKADGLLQAYSSDTITSTVKPEFLDSDNAYITTSYRPRSIFASRARVKTGEVSNYEDLADPKWRGRVCIRSGYHQYNLSLFAQMLSDRGPEFTQAFLSGLHENLARVPNGNDRAQVRGIYEDQCDLSVGNSYYMPLMLGNDKQRPWGEATYLIFPDQERGGAYILRSGAGLTTADRNVAEATKLLEFLVSKTGQDFIVNTTYEYPVIEGIEMPASTRQLGKGQPGIERGQFKYKVVPLPDIAAKRPAVVKLLDRINFDSK